MNMTNKTKNLFQNIKEFSSSNLKNIIIFISFLFIIFVSLQIYNYFKLQEIKKNSIKFFSSIDQNNEIIETLENISDGDDIFSILSKLKIIQKFNNENDFSASNILYKEIISKEKLNNLYKSSIAVHASHTLINASYVENTNEYIDDISFYINNINDDLESYISLKKELEFLLIITVIDYNKTLYQDNANALKLYNEIMNSNLVSSSVKERVKKIHEFQLYK